MKAVMVTNYQRRNQRIKSKLVHFASRARLSVHRTNAHIYAQIIDIKGRSLVTLTDKTIKTKAKTPKTAKALELGRLIGQKALDLKIKELVFDRGGNRYHGRVKAVCEGAREAGVII